MNEGFFTKKEIESTSRPDGKLLSCISCGLYKYCNSPKMKPFGNFKKGILNIGEAPGSREDQTGKPWQGKAGKLLQRTYKALGIDLFEDCLNINAVHCHPTDDKENNRTPTNYEIDCCRKFVLAIIKEYQPKGIVLLGNIAIYSLLRHRWKKDLGGVSKWRGFTIPDKDFKAWICPTFHPSYVERSEQEVETVWKQDLKQAIEKIKQPLPRYHKPKIEVITDLTVLEELDHGIIAFDYETTGLKPQATGHRIICVSIATGMDHCYVFMMPKTKKERQPFIDLLANPNVKKMAHNIKFEETWSVVRLRQEVKGWDWDSMLASHILDNRPGITRLKFQTYIHFGVVDYDSEVSPYLKATDNKNGNAFNRINELIEKPEGKKMLLEYCALDSIYEYRLAMLQREIIYYDELPF